MSVCELCGFEPRTKNKYREKQDHLISKHFREEINQILRYAPRNTCPITECGYIGKDKQTIIRHFAGKHGILEEYVREALAEKGALVFCDQQQPNSRSNLKYLEALPQEPVPHKDYMFQIVPSKKDFCDILITPQLLSNCNAPDVDLDEIELIS